MAKIITVKEAAELVQDGAVIGSAVQGMTGWPEEIGLAIENRFMETGHPSGITHIHGAARGISAGCLRTEKPAGGSVPWLTTDCFHAAYTAMWDVPLR